MRSSFKVMRSVARRCQEFMNVCISILPTASDVAKRLNRLSRALNGDGFVDDLVVHQIMMKGSADKEELRHVIESYPHKAQELLERSGLTEYKDIMDSFGSTGITAKVLFGRDYEKIWRVLYEDCV